MIPIFASEFLYTSSLFANTAILNLWSSPMRSPPVCLCVCASVRLCVCASVRSRHGRLTGSTNIYYKECCLLGCYSVWLL
jgi:hypothetical protein